VANQKGFATDFFQRGREGRKEGKKHREREGRTRERWRRRRKRNRDRDIKRE
jgi:hypothetical protein